MPEDELAWAHGPSAAQVADLEKAKKSLKSQALHFTAAAAFAQPPPPPPPAEPMTFNSEAERRFFSEPKIQELIGKMKELGDKARLTATTRKEMRLLDKFYSGEGLKQAEWDKYAISMAITVGMAVGAVLGAAALHLNPLGAETVDFTLLPVAVTLLFALYAHDACVPPPGGWPTDGAATQVVDAAASSNLGMLTEPLRGAV